MACFGMSSWELRNKLKSILGVAGGRALRPHFAAHKVDPGTSLHSLRRNKLVAIECTVDFAGHLTDVYKFAPSSARAKIFACIAAVVRTNS